MIGSVSLLDFTVRTAIAAQPRSPFSAEMSAHIDEADRFFSDLSVDATIAERRVAYDAMSRCFLGDRPSGLTIEDRAIQRPGGAPLKVRVYTPTKRTPAAGPPAVLVYFHGGGFWFGDLESHDTIVADLAAAAGVPAVAVDYRRTPEHLFPAAIEDALTACAWATAFFAGEGENEGEGEGEGEGAQPRIIVAGDSCGGTLAANVALAAEEQSAATDIVGQLLIYPVLGIDFQTPSYRDNAAAPMLDRPTMITCWDCYLPVAERQPDTLERAVPNLHRVPMRCAPAAILTAAHDPVCDDGRIYAQRLGAAGIATAYRCDGDLPHGHLRARRSCAAAGAAFQWCCDALMALTDGDATS